MVLDQVDSNATKTMYVFAESMPRWDKNSLILTEFMSYFVLKIFTGVVSILETSNNFFMIALCFIVIIVNLYVI